jgi:predicted  nucleic acid-binding Zn-ribbon protein
MRIETTAQEIRALLKLAEFDAEEPELPLDKHRSRRDAIRKRVAKALAERYQALLEAGRHPPIVAIEQGACAGCHLRLPTMVESRSRRLPGVYVCPQCRRLLYAPALLANS